MPCTQALPSVVLLSYTAVEQNGKPGQVTARLECLAAAGRGCNLLGDLVFVAGRLSRSGGASWFWAVFTVSSCPVEWTWHLIIFWCTQKVCCIHKAWVRGVQCQSVVKLGLLDILARGSCVHILRNCLSLAALYFKPTPRSYSKAEGEPCVIKYSAVTVHLYLSLFLVC